MSALDSLRTYAWSLTLYYPELSASERLSAALSVLDLGLGRLHGTMPDEINVDNRMFPDFLWYGSDS